jgi:hypothetical protein
VVGRDRQVDRAFRLLADGNNLVINDPRRMGKTSFLSRLEFLATSGLTVIYVDYEGVQSSAEFLRRTVSCLRREQPLWARTVDSLRAFFDNIDVDAGPITVSASFSERSPSELVEQVIKRVGDALHSGERVVLCLDELPLALDNIVTAEGGAAAGALLQTLRRLRSLPETQLRWILTGSVGFHHVLRRAGVTEGAVNDVLSFDIGPLGSEGAGVLARRLLRGIHQSSYDEAAVTALVTRSGGIAFLLHQLVHLLDSEAQVDVAAVDRAWSAFLDDRDGSRSMTHLVTRIEPNYEEEDRDPAMAVLDITAERDQGMGVGELLDHMPGSVDEQALAAVVDLVVDDHYLICRGGAYGWRYAVLRDIWRHRRKGRR